uniref:Uncharacterized protein n=1 Tax=Haptolina brevifila TaxID=156173 RepID=A0A7S2IRT3_9EUKA
MAGALSAIGRGCKVCRRLQQRTTLPSAATTSTAPPRALTAGIIGESTSCASSMVSSLASGSTCVTSPRSGHASRSTRSIPIFIVVVEEGQDPHAPCNVRPTPFVCGSTDTTSTLPPSAMR